MDAAKSIKRVITDQLRARIGKGKVILLFGPRQSGKTTLVREIAADSGLDTLWLSGDEADTRALLSNTTSTRLKALFGSKKLVIIDEAQRIGNIGLTLKLCADMIPETQIIATGSSAFELADATSEPLTGRKYEYHLFPLSYGEMVDHHGKMIEKRLLEHRLVYGTYPEVVTSPGEERELLSLLADSYLYKDVFSLGLVKKPVLLERIVQALALQIGSEVSYNELGQLVGADKETIERYIHMLEKCYVVFRLTSFSRNLRNELKKSRKIYFWDTGVRNAVIRNFNPLHFRQDIGGLWENFLVAERLKLNHYGGQPANYWFWRTHAQQEIDYIEEQGGVLSAWEFKWKANKLPRVPKSFLDAYPGCITGYVTPDTMEEFLLGGEQSAG
ncbi:MAG: ATP-binding protein [Deltaproteobacteria bacterium]|nr:ATP-binding protein [Deltaproteobacteria bacterium]